MLALASWPITTCGADSMFFFLGLNALSHGVVYQDISLERNSGNESWISRPILGVEQFFAHKLHTKMQLPQSNCRVPLHGHDWSHHVNVMCPSRCLFLNAFLKTSLENEPMKWIEMGEIPMHLAKDAAECNRAFKDFATSRSWEEAPQAQPTPEAHQLLGWIRMPIPAPFCHAFRTRMKLIGDYHWNHEIISGWWSAGFVFPLAVTAHVFFKKPPLGFLERHLDGRRRSSSFTAKVTGKQRKNPYFHIYSHTSYIYIYIYLFIYNVCIYVCIYI